MMSKLLLSLLFIALVGVARGEDQLWVGLYLGENKPPAAGAAMASEKLEPRLREVFGFKHYEQLHGQEINLKSNWEHWIVSRKDFFMRVQPIPHAVDEPAQVEYEVYKDGFLIAKGKYQLDQDIPLFINGPDFHLGRLIFVVETR